LWNDRGCTNIGHGNLGYVCKLDLGWSPLFLGQSYKFVKEKKTWDEARADCLSQFADLVSIHSPEENQFVTSLSDGRRFWIGGRVGISDDRPDSHDWTDRSPWDYENWGPGSPSGTYQGQPENCLENLALAHGEAEKGLWNDRGCTNIGHGNLGYVCKLNQGWSLFEGQSYKFVKEKKTWDEAWYDCLSQQANLVSIHSSEENRFVTSLSDGRRFWLGGRVGWADRDTLHDWVDNTRWNYTNWSPGSPSEVYEGQFEDCLENLALAHGEAEKGMWNDRACTNIGHGNLGYVCKR